MNKILQAIFVLILVFSTYHFARDIIQTGGMDNRFSNIAHRHHKWCGSICNEVTFPLDIAGIVVPAIVLKRNELGALGIMLLASLPLWVILSALP
jgi:hypothetical protein